MWPHRVSYEGGGGGGGEQLNCTSHTLPVYKLTWSLEHTFQILTVGLSLVIVEVMRMATSSDTNLPIKVDHSLATQDAVVLRKSLAVSSDLLQHI